MSQLPLVDIVVILVYLGLVAGIGLWMARSNDSTNEYFLGKRGFSGFVIALSMVGTSLSSITFLALPAGAYALDWRLLVSNWMMPVAAVLAVAVFVPFFRRAKVVTAYEFLEGRFGPWARLYAACSFIILQLVRVGSVLFLVSIPLSLMLDVNVVLVVIVLGVFLILYTTLGGFDAVIWTDVIQVVILAGGGLVVFGALVWQTPGGYGPALGEAYDAGKFSLGDWDLDFTRRTIVTMMVLGLIGWTGAYCTDQTVVQRIVSARTERDAKRAVWMTVAMSVPTWTFFFLIGTSVWAFYQQSNDPAVAAMAADEVFPHFIITQLPVGVTGIIIAAILAAAMSSLDSSINSVSTTFINDIYRRHLRPDATDRQYLRAAKAVSLVTGLCMIAGGLLYVWLPKESMLDVTKIIASIFGGCKLGLFLLGFFTRRVSERGILYALIPAVGLNIYLGLNAAGLLPDGWGTDLHNYWVNLTVNTVFVVFSVGLSFVGLRETRTLRGMTIWTTDLSAASADREAAADTSTRDA
ncbi:MAG: sodium/solute symporter [Planctomycetota bacterium]